MQSLHGITIASMEAWIWTTFRGGNGAYLGRINGRNVDHLMLGQRGTPPPADYIRQNRRYWNPWNHLFQNMSEEQKLTPMCGRLKTKARWPEITATYNRWGGMEHRQCPNCIALAAQTNTTYYYQNQLQADDPWAAIAREDRETMPDPVSGM